MTSRSIILCNHGRRATLRNRLLEEIAAVPRDGKIVWATYYFANLELANALIDAANRGVKINLIIESHPRRPAVNRLVLSRLKGIPGLDIVLHRSWPRHLHEKIYYFSHPEAHAWLGSYNPSTDPSLPESLLSDIGDQDAGHNVLMSVTSPRAVRRIEAHLEELHGKSVSLPENSSDMAVHFFPMRGLAPHIELLEKQHWHTAHIAMSHMRDRRAINALSQLAAKGTMVRVIGHDSVRRFPRRFEKRMIEAGVQVLRYCHPQKWPMHNKYILLEGKGERVAMIGSVNLTLTSRYLNREILLVTRSEFHYQALRQNWHELLDEIESGYGV